MEEEKEGETMRDFLYEQADKFFVDHIPIDSIKDLDTGYMYYFGAVAHLIAITMFVLFTYTNYQSTINQAFIALSTQDGSDCQSVPISISDSFYADNVGNWRGTANYSDSKAIYELVLSNFTINSYSQYADMMNSFYRSLEEVANQAIHYNLAENLIFWIVFVRYYSVQFPTATDFSGIGFGQLQYLQMTGSPSVVFDLQHTNSMISSVTGVCGVTPFTDYDQANHVLISTYTNYEAFSNHSTCTSAVYPPNFGYNAKYDDNIYELEIDVESLSVAMGINLGFMKLADLRVVTQDLGNFSYAGGTYSIGEYFDVRYPLMEPIFCVKNTSSLHPRTPISVFQFCVIEVGNTFALPVFNHYGTNSHFPSYCSCSTTGRDEVCQEFNLLTGLVFFKNKANLNLAQYNLDQLILSKAKSKLVVGLNDVGLFSLFSVLKKFPTYSSFNRAAYNASFLTVSTNYKCTGQCLKRNFEFCTVANDTSLSNNITCSLLIFNSQDALDRTVSDYKYQLQNGSCSRNMLIPESDWNQLVNVAPVQFTQIYYECYNNAQSALLAAVGIASGNVQIFLPFLAFAILPIFYIILVIIRQVPPRDEYNNKEKDEVVESLAILLLRLRDGKTRGLKKKGVLSQIVKELIAAAKEEGGYPDSDDEDDESVRSSAMSDKESFRGSAAPKSQYHGDGKDYERGSDYSEENPMHSNQDRETGVGRDTGETRKAALPRGLYVPPKALVRTKMSVFTKKLEAKQRGRQTSRLSGSNPLQRPKLGQGLVLSYIVGQNRFQQDPRKTDVYSRKSHRSDRIPSEQYQLPAQPVELMDIQEASNRKDLLVLNHVAMNPAVGIQVRRMSMKTTPLNNEEFDELISNLEKYFSEAIKIPASPPLTANTLPNQTRPPRSYSRDSDDESSVNAEDLTRRSSAAVRMTDGSKEIEMRLSVSKPNLSSRKTHPAYVNGKQLTARLAYVILDDLMARDDRPIIFLKLTNIMCMHASIELEVEMKVITTNRDYAEKITYNLGGKAVTVTALESLM